MPQIVKGQIVALYIYDVAETITLDLVPTLIGPAVPARLAPKPPTPSYVQYEKPPLSFDGELIECATSNGFTTRFRVYDYGVISVALTRSFTGDWRELIEIGQGLMDSPDVERRAERLCRSAATRLEPALVDFRKEFLNEDYLIFLIHDLDRPMSADETIQRHGDEIAALLRGEHQPLSEQEKAHILTNRLSYLANDLVVSTWNAALVYDTLPGAQAAIDILEFANTQLLEYRYYDRLLDGELAMIYPRLQHPRRYRHFFRSPYTRAAQHIHSLLIDVNELTDRTENALKFVGDVYAARLFELVGHRLGLATWKGHVAAKLKTLDDIYRFAVERASMARGHFLELTIVLILVLELVLLFLGVRK
jgi:hypothetical protein